MTINEASLLVKKLVGEDDFHDVKDVLTSYYDLAQRQIATTAAPIIKQITVKGGKVTLPEDLYRLVKVSASYVRTDRRHIEILGKDFADVTYYAYPKKLYDDTDGAVEFELPLEAQQAIPYYAAAQVVLADSDMRRHYAFMDMYNSILSNVVAAASQSSTIRVVKTEEMI